MEEQEVRKSNATSVEPHSFIELKEIHVQKQTVKELKVEPSMRKDSEVHLKRDEENQTPNG